MNSTNYIIFIYALIVIAFLMIPTILWINLIRNKFHRDNKSQELLSNDQWIKGYESGFNDGYDQCFEDYGIKITDKPTTKFTYKPLNKGGPFEKTRQNKDPTFNQCDRSK